MRFFYEFNTCYDELSWGNCIGFYIGKYLLLGVEYTSNKEGTYLALVMFNRTVFGLTMLK
ncbi:MAG: hypothetical protein CUN56_00045 [Phototrophicales bacterium]|nr:MAG: hypothetical protein CUN56_00045 [Phototrophicales bacterium]